MMDSGLVTICELQNIAEQGNMPKPTLVKLRQHFFEERTVGYGRQYAALGVNERVDYLIRIWRDAGVHTEMYAILTDYEGQINEDGDQFRIDNVQHLLNSDGLKVTDLSLYRMDKLYDVIELPPDEGQG